MLRAVLWLAMGTMTTLGSCALRPPATTGTTVVSGGPALGQPVSRFPTKQELQARRKYAPPSSASPVEIPSASVEKWSMREPLVTPGAPYSGQSRWDRMLTDALSGTTIVASEALRCAAEEAARFYVENGGYPDEALRRFLVARCGSNLVATDMGILYGTVSGVVPESKLAEEFSPKLRQLIDQAIRVQPTELGLGYAQGRGRVGFCLLLGRASGSIENESIEPSGERVELTGTTPSDTAYVLGLVTHGAYGVRRCEPDRTVPAPRFKLSCPVAREDELATIEIAGRRASEMLWNVVLRHAVQLSTGAGREYESPGPALAQVDPELFTRRLHEAINDTRRRIGQAELQLSPEQSVSNQELSRYVYDATFAKDRTQLEQSVLAILAGWDVEGAIRDGMVYWAGFEHASSPERWLAAAIESPFGRFSLFDAQKSHVAIGVHHYGKGATMSVVSTYALFDSMNHDQDESAIFKEISALRKARGKSEPGRVPRGAILTEALSKVTTNPRSADDAVAAVAERASQSAGRTVKVWVIATNSLFHFKVPDPLFADALNLEVGVTHYKPEGAAWGQYLIVFVLHGASAATALLPHQIPGTNRARAAQNSRYPGVLINARSSM